MRQARLYSSSLVIEERLAGDGLRLAGDGFVAAQLAYVMSRHHVMTPLSCDCVVFILAVVDQDYYSFPPFCDILRL